MPFHKKVFKEVFRPVKKVFKQVKRDTAKIIKEGTRPLKDVGSIFKPPVIPPFPLPPPLAPPPTKITGQASDEIRRRQRGRVSGRRKTIVTGELSPKTVGKKSLLGR